MEGYFYKGDKGSVLCPATGIVSNAQAGGMK